MRRSFAYVFTMFPAAISLSVLFSNLCLERCRPLSQLLLFTLAGLGQDALSFRCFVCCCTPLLSQCQIAGLAVIFFRFVLSMQHPRHSPRSPLRTSEFAAADRCPADYRLSALHTRHPAEVGWPRRPSFPSGDVPFPREDDSLWSARGLNAHYQSARGASVSGGRLPSRTTADLHEEMETLRAHQDRFKAMAQRVEMRDSMEPEDSSFIEAEPEEQGEPG